MANSDTIQSGAVGCSGIRGWFIKLRAVGSGSLMSSGWYLRVERCEEGSGIRDSLMVEGRNPAGQVLERRELQGILYDEATGEEEEWVVDVGSDKERRAWGVACKARQELIRFEHSLCFQSMELEAAQWRGLAYR